MTGPLLPGEVAALIRALPPRRPNGAVLPFFLPSCRPIGRPIPTQPASSLSRYLQ